MWFELVFNMIQDNCWIPDCWSLLIRPLTLCVAASRQAMLDSFGRATSEMGWVPLRSEATKKRRLEHWSVGSPSELS